MNAINTPLFGSRRSAISLPWGYCVSLDPVGHTTVVDR